MTIDEATRLIIAELSRIYDRGEAAGIAELVMEHVTGLKRTERISTKSDPVSIINEHRIKKYLRELIGHKPVQYVLNEAWFVGMKFYVDENVLIPRPETEELVEWVTSDINSSEEQHVSILDVGTGSGCIAIAIKKLLPHATVYATDISEGALSVAKKNAELNKAVINFVLSDFLDEKKWDELKNFDIVVSNPPYIPVSEHQQLSDNVKRYEPHTALFVNDADPLIFYRAIAKFASKKSKKIFVEVHENYAPGVNQLFEEFEFSTIMKKDINGKDRMIMAFT
jgi:release factor glutamine methyltransferase